MTKNEEVAERFAEGSGIARTKHLFIEGNTIYSYGHHFPIAKRIGNHEAEFTEQGYSVTTSRHKNLVKRALEDKGWKIKKVKQIF